MIRTVAAYCLRTLLIFIAVYAALMTAFYHQGRILLERQVSPHRREGRISDRGP